MHPSSFSTLLTVFLLASQTAALPRRYTTSVLSAFFSSQSEDGQSSGVLQRPFIAAAVVSAQQPSQQLPLSPWAPNRDLATLPHPTPLATAQPYPLNEEPNYSRVCNLGHLVSPRQEDAAEIAYAECQGGIVRRGKANGEEALECVACEWGTLNAVRGEINR